MLIPYRGEELGVPKVADIPDADRLDPTFFRNNGTEIGRDGCRVPIIWEKSSKNIGFGDSKPAHMPQPQWMGEYSVKAEDTDPSSNLNMYRKEKALGLRGKLQSAEKLEWVNDEAGTTAFQAASRMDGK